jgi:hypothetical protein
MTSTIVGINKLEKPHLKAIPQKLILLASKTVKSLQCPGQFTSEEPVKDKTIFSYTRFKQQDNYSNTRKIS